MTIRTLVLFSISLMGSVCYAANCPLTPIRLIADKHVGLCVRTVGIVTFIRRESDIFHVELSDRRGNKVGVDTSVEPSLNEVVQTSGTVSKTDMFEIKSERLVTIKRFRQTPKQ